MIQNKNISENIAKKNSKELQKRPIMKQDTKKNLSTALRKNLMRRKVAIANNCDQIQE